MKEFDYVRDTKTGRIGIIVDDRSIFKGKKVLEIEYQKDDGDYDVFSRFEDEVEPISVHRRANSNEFKGIGIH